MRRFWSDRKGNVAVLFAIAIVPVIGMMGAAVDYSLANSYRTDIQKSLDATALALSKVLPLDDEEKLHAIGMQYFMASLGNNDLKNLKLEVFPEQGKVRLHASGDYTPKIANIFGATQFKIGTSAEAVWSMGKVEIALVLDMSLSMQSPSTARIEALRAATIELLAVLKKAAKNEGDAKIGIVPFDGMINTGYTSTTAPSWIRWDWWDANAYDSISNRCKTANGTSINFNLNNVPVGRWLKQHCEQQTVNVTPFCQGGSGNNKTACEKTKGATWITQQSGIWTKLDHKEWNGCVYDRNQTGNYDISDADPTNNASNYPAAKCYATPPQMMTDLSYDWTTLESKAKALQPTGYTNINIGLVWGWQMVSEGGVYFANAQSKDTPELTKYVILMTDGFNSKNILKEPTSDCPTAGPSCPAMDARTPLICNAIKADGVQIYTVRLIDGNENLLRNCASRADMYYDVTTTNNLANAFNAIGSQIASLHLAK